MISSSQKPKRAKNASKVVGRIRMLTLGKLSDSDDYDAMTVNEASDIDLAFALSMRGYDIYATTPTPVAIQRRNAKRVVKTVTVR